MQLTETNLPDVSDLPGARYHAIAADLIQTEDKMLEAQQCIANLRQVLLAARKVHPHHDYLRLAEPVLLEIQQREQEILKYLGSDQEQRIAS